MFKQVKAKLPEYIKNGAMMVDVRSPDEFRTAHAEGCINIPLQELSTKLSSLDPNKTILLCCASGNRSGMAASLLKSNGFKNVINAGPWNNLVLEAKI